MTLLRSVLMVFPLLATAARADDLRHGAGAGRLVVAMMGHSLTQAEAHALVQRYVVPFLEDVLVGDTRYDAFLTAPALPGVDVQSAR